MQNIKLATLVAALLAVAPASASAAGSFDDGYGGQGNQANQVAPAEQSQVADDTASTPSSASAPSSNSATPPASTPAPTAAATNREVSSGSLPFTGTDAGLIALAGFVVLALGLGVRRLSRTEPLA